MHASCSQTLAMFFAMREDQAEEAGGTRGGICMQYGVPGNGDRALFWTDNWVDGKPICDLAPTLVTLVAPIRKKTRTVSQALALVGNGTPRWVRDITGGLSVGAVIEYLHFWEWLRHTQLTPGVEDMVRWRWTSSGQFTVQSAYQALQLGRTAFHGADRIWKAWAPLRIKLFFWLASKGRIWTADRRRRRGLDAHDTCLMCDQANETPSHLLVSCPLAKEVWWQILSWAHCTCTFLAGEVSIQDWWEHIIAIQAPGRRKGVCSLFMAVGWHLWKERNARLFERSAAVVSVIIARIKQEVDLWVAAGARKLGSLFCE
ncbi:unnamed protein product [Urochloa decumbens]|uniref:Reverse transcriptase zinc-binding domain-containing protein n=1 Tax=Urochloa decumbens TaxID=240449 RepID=A0ABC9CXS3_9POAL